LSCSRISLCGELGYQRVLRTVKGVTLRGDQTRLHPLGDRGARAPACRRSISAALSARSVDPFAARASFWAAERRRAFRSPTASAMRARRAEGWGVGQRRGVVHGVRGRLALSGTDSAARGQTLTDSGEPARSRASGSPPGHCWATAPSSAQLGVRR
jgi:hypothetical protein